jgi:hypothetical protein
MKRSPTLLAAVAVYVVVLAARLYFILTIVTHDTQVERVFGLSLAAWYLPTIGVLIDAFFCAGLWLRQPWARWLTSLRVAIGIVWSLYDVSEMSRRAGGFEYLFPAERSGAYLALGGGAAMVVVVVLLLLPSTGRDFDRSPFAE